MNREREGRITATISRIEDAILPVYARAERLAVMVTVIILTT
jgi:hypothetical protein